MLNNRLNTLLPSISPRYFSVLLLGLLSACSISPDKSMDELISDAVRNQIDEEQFDDGTQKTPEYYIRLASESEGELQQQYLVKAAELLYQRGDIDSAQDQLKTIKADDIADSRQIQIQLLAAKIALANHNPAQTIELLPKQKRMTVRQFIEISEIRAEANMAMGYLMEAIKTRVQIDSYYKDEALREKNHIATWSALNALPSIVLDKLRSSHSTLQGWLELARVMRSAQINEHELKNNLLNWKTHFPEHPVSQLFISQLLDEYLNRQIGEHTIAILLPLNGPYKTITKAIKSGFLSAYYADTKSINKPSIRFYDTSVKDWGFMALYQKAVQEGADYVLGPLDKATINQLTQLNESGINLEVPLLTLNYAENALNNTPNLYQFGLLPEDEARQVAELAIRQNKTKAAILAPDTPWGKRLKNAFQQRYTELGGSVLSTQFFNDQIDDYGQPIKRLFNLQHSERRHQDIERLLGTQLKFSPYRRQDIDMIFIAATSRSARGIMPAFKFHHASGIPVYSTSHVYSGNKNKSADLDLNGLTFCDLPWTLTANNEPRTSFNKNWPEQKNLTRLFALGIDSYHLLYNLNLLSKYEYARFSGQTGNIYMDANQRLHRELLWAKFKRGTARYIDTTIAPKVLKPIEKDQS